MIMSKKDYLKGVDEQAERRFISHPVGYEIREDQEQGEIRGIAIKVNSESNLGWYREVIMPGAFDDVLGDDVRALFNHDPNLILGRTKSGTLELYKTEAGDLGYRYATPDRSYAKDLEDAIKAGDVSQSSFGFRVKEDSWEYSEDHNTPDLRKIHKLERLYDVSPVTYPAYQDTTVAKRSADHAQESRKTKEAPELDAFEAQYLINKNSKKW